jgi:predicted AAA+ superfamily ATPase
MWFKRLIDLTLTYSFFLFGARNTGKSTLLTERFTPDFALWINLLQPEQEWRFARNPSELRHIVQALPSNITHIVIDEVQKVPALLNVVHELIVTTSKKFVMTGSSARRLKHGSANLLAGRAFVYNLYPLTSIELGEYFNLDDALRWGTLPQVISLPAPQDKQQFLQAYTQTYLKEEIWAEQFVKQLEPFRNFLEVAAQANGKIVNYANIARDTGISDKVVKEYFSLLEDTLIGFHLPPFLHSFRKRLSHKPKFYFFDLGVVRALTQQLSIPLQAGTSGYGEAFEHFIILECMSLARYANLEYRFSFLRTKDDVELDLVIERPGNSLLLIEIKSKNQVTGRDVASLNLISKELENSEAVCFSQDLFPKKYDNVLCLHWQDGLKRFFQKL